MHINNEPKHIKCMQLNQIYNQYPINRVLCEAIKKVTVWCQGNWNKKAHYISTLGYNLCRLENTKRTSEVETHPSSLWSHRERWRGLASFCDSSGHASCKREEGIREGERARRITINRPPSQVIPCPPPIKQVEELYVLCIQHFQECSATQQDRAMLFKRHFQLPKCHCQCRKHPWCVNLN